MDIFVVKYTGKGLVVKQPGVLSKVQMLNLVLGVGIFSLLPIQVSLGPSGPEMPRKSPRYLPGASGPGLDPKKVSKKSWGQSENTLQILFGDSFESLFRTNNLARQKQPQKIRLASWGYFYACLKGTYGGS